MSFFKKKNETIHTLRKEITETARSSVFPIVCVLEYMDASMHYEEKEWVWWTNKLKNTELNRARQVLYVRTSKSP